MLFDSHLCFLLERSRIAAVEVGLSATFRQFFSKIDLKCELFAMILVMLALSFTMLLDTAQR